MDSNDSRASENESSPPEAHDAEAQHLSQILISPPLSPPEAFPPMRVSAQEISRIIALPTPNTGHQYVYISPFIPSSGIGRNGFPFSPSTLPDPDLQCFLDGCSLLNRMRPTRYPSPEPLCSITSATPHLYKDPCAFCLYYSFLNASTRHRPLRDSYDHCTLYAANGNKCGLPSLFHCHYCDNVVCEGCQRFFQREFETIQPPKPQTMRKRFRQSFGPVNNLSILSAEFQSSTPTPLSIHDEHSSLGFTNKHILIVDDDDTPSLEEVPPANREGATLVGCCGALFNKNALPSNERPIAEEHEFDGTYFLDGGCVNREGNFAESNFNSSESFPNAEPAPEPLTRKTHKLDGVFFLEAKCVRKRSSFALVAYHHQSCYISAKTLTHDHDSSDAAELHALLRALTFARQNDLKHILLITSSETVADFIKGIRRISQSALIDIAMRIEALFGADLTVFVSHINYHCAFLPEFEVADALCTWAIRTGMFLGCHNPCRAECFMSPTLNRMHAVRHLALDTRPSPSDCPLCYQQHQAADCPISLFSRTNFTKERCEGCFSPSHSSEFCPTAACSGRRPVLSPLSLRDNWFVADGLPQGSPLSSSAFIAASTLLAPSQ
jgi:hypothetical protein